MITQRPYPEPPPRPFEVWCIALGLEARPGRPLTDRKLSFDDFSEYPNIKFYKVAEGELYGFWRKYGDVWGECRTVEEWLKDFNWELDDPTNEDLQDLNLFLAHDEFWIWSSGKIAYKDDNLWGSFRKLIRAIRRK